MILSVNFTLKSGDLTYPKINAVYPSLGVRHNTTFFESQFL